MKPNVDELNKNIKNKVWKVKEFNGEWGIYGMLLPEPIFKIKADEVIINNLDENNKPVSERLIIPTELINVIKIVQDYLNNVVKP